MNMDRSNSGVDSPDSLESTPTKGMITVSNPSLLNDLVCDAPPAPPTDDFDQSGNVMDYQVQAPGAVSSMSSYQYVSSDVEDEIPSILTSNRMTAETFRPIVSTRSPNPLPLPKSSAHLLEPVSDDVPPLRLTDSLVADDPKPGTNKEAVRDSLDSSMDSIDLNRIQHLMKDGPIPKVFDEYEAFKVTSNITPETLKELNISKSLALNLSPDNKNESMIPEAVSALSSSSGNDPDPTPRPEDDPEDATPRINSSYSHIPLQSQMISSPYQTLPHKIVSYSVAPSALSTHAPDQLDNSNIPNQQHQWEQHSLLQQTVHQQQLQQHQFQQQQYPSLHQQQLIPQQHQQQPMQIQPHMPLQQTLGSHQLQQHQFQSHPNQQQQLVMFSQEQSKYFSHHSQTQQQQQLHSNHLQQQGLFHQQQLRQHQLQQHQPQLLQHQQQFQQHQTQQHQTQQHQTQLLQHQQQLQLHQLQQHQPQLLQHQQLKGQQLTEMQPELLGEQEYYLVEKLQPKVTFYGSPRQGNQTQRMTSLSPKRDPSPERIVGKVAPKPPRPPRDFVERNINKARGVSSAKSSYSMRLVQKRQDQEKLSEWAPGPVIPRKAAASADNATRNPPTDSSPRALQMFQPISPGHPEDDSAALWHQRAEMLSQSKKGKPTKSAANQTQKVPNSPTKFQRQAWESHNVVPDTSGRESQMTEMRVKIDLNLPADETGNHPVFVHRLEPVAPNMKLMNQQNQVLKPVGSIQKRNQHISPHLNPQTQPDPEGSHNSYAKQHQNMVQVGSAPIVQSRYPIYVEEENTSKGVEYSTTMKNKKTDDIKSKSFNQSQSMPNLQSHHETAVPVISEDLMMTQKAIKESYNNLYRQSHPNLSQATPRHFDNWDDHPAMNPSANHSSPDENNINPYAAIPPIGSPDPSKKTQRRKSESKAPAGGYAQAYKAHKQKISSTGPSYQKYTLDDYKKINTDVKLGGLGPTEDPDKLREKQENRLKQIEYAKKARELVSVAKTQPNTSENKKPTSRQLAVEYARTVPKPKVTAHGQEETTKRLDLTSWRQEKTPRESDPPNLTKDSPIQLTSRVEQPQQVKSASSVMPQMLKDYLQPNNSEDQLITHRSNTDPTFDFEYLETIELLHKRHLEDKQKISQIRYKV